jgi:lysozyme family protein
MGGFSKAPTPPIKASGGNSDADLPIGADFTTPSPKPKPSPRASFLSELSGSGFGLSASVGSGAANRPDDVFRLESVLDGAGLLGRKPGRAFGNDTQKAITTAQQSFNTSHAKRLGLTSLKEDGLVNPDGPTQSATRKLAGSLIGDDQEVANILKMRQAEEAKTTAAAQRSKMVKAAVENARRNPRSLLDRTPKPTPKAAVSRPVRTTPQPVKSSIPNAGQPWWRQGGLKPLDAAGDASNQRTADHLRTIHGVGDIPRWTSDALETAGDKGVADVADLLEKVHKNNPDQARQLADETFQRLSESTQKRLRAMEKAPQSVETETKFSAEHTAAKEVKIQEGASTERKSGPAKAKDRMDGYFERLKIHEGLKFTNDPIDDGGPTKIGVTQESLDAYHVSKGGRARNIPINAKDLEPKHARQIYQEFYYDRYRVGEINSDDLAEHVLDININPGPGRSARWAQEAFKEVTGSDMSTDGIMGTRTIKVLNKLTPEQEKKVMNGIAARREVFYRDIVRKNPKKQKYLKGWIDRTRSFLR